MVLDLPQPWLGAHIVLSDQVPVSEWANESGTGGTFPKVYNDINFKAVDVLYMDPFIVNNEGLFQIGTKADGGQSFSLADRFEFVLRTARLQNPKIRIIAGQRHTGLQGLWELADNATKSVTEMVDTYTDSVTKFLVDRRNQVSVSHEGQSVSLRVDGYDISTHSGEFFPSFTKDILSKLRMKFDKVSQTDPQKRQFIISISPTSAVYRDDHKKGGNEPDSEGIRPISELAASCDFVNMQPFGKGISCRPERYVGQGQVDPNKLTYGVELSNVARNQTPVEFLDNPQDQDTAAKVLLNRILEDIKGINGVPYRGIWTWRLGSSSEKWHWENWLQVWFYNRFNGTKLEAHGTLPTDEFAFKGWNMAFKQGASIQNRDP